MSYSLVEHEHNYYRRLRGIQISAVFTITILIQEFFHIPHAGWMGFAVMMIYVGFDNGTTIVRAFHRFVGMLLGLLSGYVLWFIAHLDYRTLTITVPMCVFFAYFFTGREYSVPTIFTVNTSVIGTAYFYDHSSFTVTGFLADYLACTIFAFSLIIVCEYFYFKPNRMMRYFIYDIETHVLNSLITLTTTLGRKRISHYEWFKHCIEVTSHMSNMNELLTSAQFIKQSNEAVGGDFKLFVRLSNRIYRNQKALYFAHYGKRYGTKKYFRLFDQVLFDLSELKHIHQKLTVEPLTIGEQHEARA